MLAITEQNFEELVTKSDKPVVLDFWAGWCGPCKMQGPVFEAAAAKHPEALFAKVNVDEQPNLAEKFGVMGIPTLVFLKDGKVVKKTVGYQEEEEIDLNLAELL